MTNNLEILWKNVNIKENAGNPGVWRERHAEKKSLSGDVEMEAEHRQKSIVYHRCKADLKDNADPGIWEKRI